MIAVKPGVDRQFEEVARQIRRLATQAAPRASSNAIRDGLRVLAKAIQAAAPVGPTRRVRGRTIEGGALKRSVGSRIIRARGASTSTLAKAGLNVGKGKAVAKGSKLRAQNTAPHAHLVTLGTRDRWAGVKVIYRRQKGKPSLYKGEKLTGKKIRFLGKVEPNDFVRRASAAAEPAAIEAIRNRLLKELEKEAAKK